MIRLALDAMGGDHAPDEIIAGGLSAARELKDLQLNLVGPKDVLQKHLQGQEYPKDRVKLVHAPEVIANDDATEIDVRRKRNPTKKTATTMDKQQKADSIPSA